MATPRRRATDRIRAKPEGLLGRLRLRHKLALMLIIAALLPVVGASTVAIQLVLQALQSGAKTQTERTMRVALNLVLAHVKEVFEGTLRLSESPGLPEAIRKDAQAATDLMSRHSESLLPGLVELAGPDGKIIARLTVGGRAAAGLQVADNSPPIQTALAYERRVDLARTPTGLVIRSSAPVVDDDFRLAGAVVTSVPLDAEFADRLKAQLSADVVVYLLDAPSASSFVAPDGRREVGFAVPREVAARVLGGANEIVEARAYDRLFSVGLAPLQDLAGNRLGIVAVAVTEEALAEGRSQAWRSLILGGAGAVVFALVLATLLSRRLTRPIGHLHAGAIAVARGDLDHRIIQETGDEIGDLAVAFAQMTRGLKENRDRLAARMREIVTLHDIGRAVSSVLALDEVLHKTADEVGMVFSARRCAILLVGQDGALGIGAVHGGPSEGLADLAEAIAWRGGPVRIEEVASDMELQRAARAANVEGSLMAVPLEEKDRVLGMLLVTRRHGQSFSEADLRLLAMFAHQCATAIVNARLYDELQKASTQLEAKVEERTAELLVANRDLGQALVDLRQAQSALVHSERMAGLGQLVAGVAHEVNSPAAAIQGAVDNLAENVTRLAKRARELGEVKMPSDDRTRFFALVEQLAPQLGATRIEAPAQIRRGARELSQRLAELGLSGVESSCRTLVEVGASDAAYQLAQLAERAVPPDRAASDPIAVQLAFEALVGYLEEYAYLSRNTHAIRTAIQRITRIVGALKGYSHLDEAKVSAVDIHEGIENTLIILHSELKYGIILTRKYAPLPPVPIYVDELNQVWTNLIHNAVQALGGKGEILIETALEGAFVTVAIEDNGPGISRDVMPRIFEPFFTTKPKGEGTGLGLGIVKQIIDKHGGRIQVDSKPGQTRFTVVLPIVGPPVAKAA
jgi:signal transduction histidine kinase